MNFVIEANEMSDDGCYGNYKPETYTHTESLIKKTLCSGNQKQMEWRNFLLLDGILPTVYLRHFQLQAQAVFLMSRDIVAEDDCNVAERLFHEYVTKFKVTLAGRTCVINSTVFCMLSSAFVSGDQLSATARYILNHGSLN